MKSFTKEQLIALQSGLTRMFQDIGVDAHLKLIETSKRSVSLYIHFNNCEARTVRISTHPPNFAQKDYINITIKEPSNKLR